VKEKDLKKVNEYLIYQYESWNSNDELMEMKIPIGTIRAGFYLVSANDVYAQDARNHNDIR
jgi:hypothetical protein